MTPSTQSCAASRPASAATAGSSTPSGRPLSTSSSRFGRAPENCSSSASAAYADSDAGSCHPPPLIRSATPLPATTASAVKTSASSSDSLGLAVTNRVQRPGPAVPPPVPSAIGSAPSSCGAEALAVELGRRYNHALQEANSEVFTPANATLPLDGMLDTALDPVIDFCDANPGFEVLLQSTETPGLVAKEHEAVHTTIVSAVEGMLALRAPDLSRAEIARTTTMSFGIFKAGLRLFMAAADADREAYRAEIKRALFGYLAPVVGTDAIPPPG